MSVAKRNFEYRVVKLNGIIIKKKRIRVLLTSVFGKVPKPESNSPFLAILSFLDPITLRKNDEFFGKPALFGPIVDHGIKLKGSLILIRPRSSKCNITPEKGIEGSIVLWDSEFFCNPIDLAISAESIGAKALLLSEALKEYEIRNFNNAVDPITIPVIYFAVDIFKRLVDGKYRGKTQIDFAYHDLMRASKVSQTKITYLGVALNVDLVELSNLYIEDQAYRNNYRPRMSLAMKKGICLEEKCPLA